MAPGLNVLSNELGLEIFSYALPLQSAQRCGLTDANNPICLLLCVGRGG